MEASGLILGVFGLHFEVCGLHLGDFMGSMGYSMDIVKTYENLSVFIGLWVLGIQVDVIILPLANFGSHLGAFWWESGRTAACRTLSRGYRL